MLGEGILLLIALSMDSFIISFAYGISKCKPSIGIVLMMNLICSLMFGAALFIGSALGNWIPSWITQKICFLVLFIMGSYKLYSSWKQKDTDTQDKTKAISWGEGAILAVALSMDGVVVGVGAGLLYTYKWILTICSYFTGLGGMMLGWHLGFKSRTFFSKDISWISGVCLLFLALRTIIS